jgi:hypothetical protein
LRSITSPRVNFGFPVVARSKKEKGRASSKERVDASVEETKSSCIDEDDPADRPGRSITATGVIPIAAAPYERMVGANGWTFNGTTGFGTCQILGAVGGLRPR